jgi:hypothetical protein
MASRARYYDPPASHHGLMMLLLAGGVGYFAWRSGYLALPGLPSPVNPADDTSILPSGATSLFTSLENLLTPETSTTPTTSTATTAPTPSVTAGVAPGRSASDPRPIRLNNPGDIVYSAANNWQGQIGSDGTFAIFDTAVNGMRAAFVLLGNYINSLGLNTISAISARWAPAPANNPATYAKTVAAYSGIAVNADLQTSNMANMIRLLRGIIGAEAGAAYVNYFSDNDMQAAYHAAGLG